MEQARGKTSSSRRGGHGALANKRAADSRARALVPIIRKLTAAGFVSQRELADELNRRAIPTARGGRWHYTTVVTMLTRLGLKTHGNPMINNGQALKRAADARAKVLAPTIRALQGRGLVSFNAIARVERARDTSGTGRQMAPKQRYPTAAPRGKAATSLKQQTSPLGPFFAGPPRFFLGHWHYKESAAHTSSSTPAAVISIHTKCCQLLGLDPSR
jgi:hypothetical protein